MPRSARSVPSSSRRRVGDRLTLHRRTRVRGDVSRHGSSLRARPERPANPRKAGELKLPGFSTYLQATDDSHLLAIGIDLPPDATNWRDRSLQLSIFDVSNMTLPRRTVQYRIGSAWAWSEALWTTMPSTGSPRSSSSPFPSPTGSRTPPQARTGARSSAICGCSRFIPTRSRSGVRSR